MNEQVRIAIERVGGGSALAAAIGRSPQFVSQLLRGTRPVPAEVCPLIERVTAGVVRCEALRPDIDWGVLRGSAPQAELADSTTSAAPISAAGAPHAPSEQAA